MNSSMYYEFDDKLIGKMQHYCRSLTRKTNIIEPDELLSIAYLRLHRKVKYGINASYVYTTIKRILIDEYKRRKHVSFNYDIYYDDDFLARVEDGEFWFSLSEEEHLILGLKVHNAPIEQVQSVVSLYNYYKTLEDLKRKWSKYEESG